MTFEDILTNDDVLDGLWDMHFDECTPIQELAIPPVLDGHDILACAQTGTGKTAAYLLPIINQLADGGYPEDSINCVVMAPTRELAQQIDRQLQGFAYFMPVSGIAIYGGTDGDTYEQQRRALKLGADVVIATPGRLLAHLNMGYVDLSKVSFFILDEADRMLDMGFYDDIMRIVAHLPKERQTLLFSATMPDKIQRLASKLLKDPVEIKIAVSKPAENINQEAYVCHENHKLPILKGIFKENAPERVIVFSSSKQKVKNLARDLRGNKFKIAEMHSDLEQTERDTVMHDFKAGKTQVIVATDILARGIDIDDIEMVVNFDVPREAEDYVHRIGRTARANRSGRAVTFISPDEIYRMKRIEELLEAEVPKTPLPAEFGEPIPYTSSKRQRGSSGRGGSKGRGSRKFGSRSGKPGKGHKSSAKEKTATANNVPDTPTANNTKPSGNPNKGNKHHNGHRRRKPSNRNNSPDNN